MIYAISDIHGCWDKYRKLLKKINFGLDDTLYVLGNVTDRGPDGFKLQNCKDHCNSTYFIKGDGKSKVELTNPMPGDKLHNLSVEYDPPGELLTNVTVQRLVEDVDFVRGPRIGKMEGM